MSIKSKITRGIKHRLKQHLTEPLYLKAFECLYPFYKNQLAPPQAHWQYRLNAQQIYNAPRKNGLSAYYRLYNEADFLEASVLSHLPFFDELILVHDSTTTDKTPQIAQALAKQYPHKIKYFFYEPAVVKLRTRAHKILSANHPNSIVNYSNFSLSKTTRNIVAKVDGDHIAIDSAFAKITQNSHDVDFMQNTYYRFCGLNLWFIDGKIYVDALNIPGIHGDQGFHIIKAQKHYHTKITGNNECSRFLIKNLQHKNAGILYFHLKNMRSNIPYQSYRGASDEVHQKRFKKRLFNAQKHLLDWKTFIAKYRDHFLQITTTDIKDLPDPNEYLRDLLKTIPSLDKI